MLSDSRTASAGCSQRPRTRRTAPTSNLSESYPSGQLFRLRREKSSMVLSASPQPYLLMNGLQGHPTTVQRHPSVCQTRRSRERSASDPRRVLGFGCHPVSSMPVKHSSRHSILFSELSSAPKPFNSAVRHARYGDVQLIRHNWQSPRPRPAWRTRDSPTARPSKLFCGPLRQDVRYGPRLDLRLRLRFAAELQGLQGLQGLQD